MLLFLSLATPALSSDFSGAAWGAAMAAEYGDATNGYTDDCDWFGTSPFCGGDCPSDYVNTQPNDLYGEYNDVPPGLDKEKFGASCLTGYKVHCCKKNFWNKHSWGTSGQIPCKMIRRSKDGTCGILGGLYHVCDNSVEESFNICNVETQKCVATHPNYGTDPWNTGIYDSGTWDQWWMEECAEDQFGSEVKYGSLAHGDGSCYTLGSSTAERDAFCSGEMLCARQGYDNRNFGDCGGHCCSNPLPEWSPKCHTPGEKYYSDETCAGDMVCRQKGVDGSKVGCKAKFCCTRPEGSPVPDCWVDACGGFGRRRLYGFPFGPGLQCISVQTKGAFYKVQGKCYKALTGCNGCLSSAASHPQHLQEVACPASQCVEHAAVEFAEPAESSNVDRPELVYGLAAVGLCATLYAAYTTGIKKVTNYEQL